MTVIVTQIVLIAAAVGVLLMLLRHRESARSKAWQKLILVAFVALAIVTVLRPDMTSTVAHWVGIGRGADLLLYLLTAVFVYVAAAFYLKFRDVERQMTVLARRLAIDEARTLRGQGDGPA